METRLSKRTHGVGTEANEDLTEAVMDMTEHQSPDKEMIPVQPQKRKKTVKYSPGKLCESYLSYYHHQFDPKLTPATYQVNTYIANSFKFGYG